MQSPKETKKLNLKGTKKSLISDILSLTKSQLVCVKSEPLSESESSIKSKKKSKNNNKKNLNDSNVIDQLVSKVSLDLSTKKKRKSKDCVDNAFSPVKKVKTEKISEDDFSQTSGIIQKSLNKSISVVTPSNNDTKEKHDISAERADLEKLFANSLLDESENSKEKPKRKPATLKKKHSSNSLLLNDTYTNVMKNVDQLTTSTPNKSILKDTSSSRRNSTQLNLAKMSISSTTKFNTSKNSKISSALESHSDSDGSTVPQPIKTEKLILNSVEDLILQRNECSSSEAENLPQPIKVKTEESRKTKKKLEKPSIISSKKSQSFKASSSENLKIQQKVADRQISSSSSDEEISVPIKAEKVKRNKQGKSAKEDTPIKNSNTSILSPQIVNNLKKNSSSKKISTAEDESSSSEENISKSTPSQARKIQQNVADTQNRHGSSDEEISVPTPIPIKAEKLKKNKQGKSSKEDISIKNSNTSILSPKIGNNLKQNSSLKKFSTSEDESSSSDENMSKSTPNQTRKKQQNVNDTQNRSSSSDEEVSVPTPIPIKAEKLKKNKQIEQKVSSSKKKLSTSEEESSSSDEDIPKSTPIQTGKVNKASPIKKLTTYNESSESEEDVTNKQIPIAKSTPEKVAKNHKKQPVVQENCVRSKKPQKQKESTPNNSRTEAFSYNENSSDMTVPKPIQIKAEKNNNKNKTAQKFDENESSDSDDEVPALPKPIHVKIEDKKLSKKKSRKETEISNENINLKLNGIINNLITKSSTPSKVIQEKGVPESASVLNEAVRKSSKKKSRKSPNGLISENNVEAEHASTEETLNKSLEEPDQNVTQNDQEKYSRIPERSINNTENSDYGADSNSDADNIQMAKRIKLNDSEINQSMNTTSSSWRDTARYKAMDWKEKLKCKYPDITKEQPIMMEVPPSNAKISLILIPKSINPESLLKLKCDLTKPKTISLGGEKYIFEPLPKKPDPVMINFNQPKLIQLESTIYLRKEVPLFNIPDIEKPIREDIALPSQMKERHPLFGANFKRTLKLDKSIRKKLQEAEEHKRKYQEKQRKKKNKSKRKEQVEENVLKIFNSIGNSVETDNSHNNTTVKRSKKRKSNNNNNNNNNNGSLIIEDLLLLESPENGANRKKEKRKHKLKA